MSMNPRKPSRKTPTVLLLILLALGLAGGILAYSLWNKPHARVEQMLVLERSPESLAAAFAENEDQANKAYVGQAIRLESEIVDIIVDEQGKTVLVLEIPGYDLYLSATLRDDPPPLERGGRVQITGFCSGATMFDILLSESIINHYTPPAAS